MYKQPNDPKRNPEMIDMEDPMSLDDDFMLELYRYMVLGRMFEERVEQLANQGHIPGSVHLGIGEEASHVGACLAVSKDEYLLPSHRGHAADLAKGSDPKRLMAEIVGRSTGCCGGRAGSIHFADATSHNLGVQGIIGAVFPVAVGAALTQKRLNTGRIVLAIFGEGASNQGTFHEGMNISALWQLPVIWVCVNNLYAMGTRFDVTSSAENVADRASAYDMPGKIVDGNDILAVYDAVCQARERALEGQGPSLIECKTYRYRGHSSFDRNPYRSQEEIDAWLKRDPIPRFEKELRKRGLMDDELQANIIEEIQAQINEAEEFALNSPEPEPESAGDMVFGPSEVSAS
jgi:TPP-dependent pyruvate/acetoin dehydrogenase alpha subunit